MPALRPAPTRLVLVTRRALAAFAGLLALTSCGANDTAETADATADSSGATMPAAVTQGLSTPESVLWDAARRVWYVSNINGSPGAKDDNGYIVRLAANGAVMDSVPFINGADEDITLDAPKGMALTGDTLWVSDIDAVRGYNVSSGMPVASIDLAPMRATFLNDAVTGPDGTVYISDTGIAFDASGNVTHPGKSRVFAIKAGAATEAVVLPQGSAVNGIAWDSTLDALVMVSFASPAIWAWTPGATAAVDLGAGVGGADGLLVLDGSRLIYTSWADSSLNVFADGRSMTLRKELPDPADLGYDPARRLIAIPLFSANRVEFWTVPE